MKELARGAESEKVKRMEARHPSSRNGRKILIIDDEPLVRRLASQILATQGYSTWEAGDGKSGEAIFDEVRPDLTIVDVWMPEQDGLQTIRQLREKSPNARILVMSGQPRRAGMPVLEVASALGALDAILKPFTPDELLSAVTKVLEP